MSFAKYLKKSIRFAVLPLLLVGCIYRLEISQGSILKKEDVEKLRIGMNKAQAEYILGGPSLDPTFDPNRWDYVYRLIDRKKRITYKKGYLIFEDDILTEIHMEAFAEDSPEENPKESHKDSPEDNPEDKKPLRKQRGE